MHTTHIHNNEKNRTQPPTRRLVAVHGGLDVVLNRVLHQEQHLLHPRLQIPRLRRPVRRPRRLVLLLEQKRVAFQHLFLDEIADGVPPSEYALLFVWPPSTLKRQSREDEEKSDRLKGKYSKVPNALLKIKVEDGNPLILDEIELKTK